MKTKKKSNIPTIIATNQHEQSLKDIKERIDNGSIPGNPTRLFKVGDSVKIGALENVTITEVFFDGLAYAIHYDYIDNQSQVKHKIGDGVWEWINIFPMTAYSRNGDILKVKDDVQIRYYNNNIDSLLHKVYHAGVDMSPNYQRELVWTDSQKTALLDSIFNNIEIGKFTFIQKDYYPGRIFYYEILDGKQRLSTLKDYYEDRFPWRGCLFSQLSFADAHHFTEFPIIQGEVSDITEQQILRLFIKMNTSGTPVSQEHLDKIKSMIK